MGRRMSYIKPRISSITANYNNDKFLLDAINSLINQTMVIDNIIVVDDCSTDQSWNILFNFMMDIASKEKCSIITNTSDKLIFSTSKNKFYFIKNKENKGPAFSRNVALKTCIDLTDIICICDSDDIYYPDKVKKSVDVMRDIDGILLVYSDYNVLNMKDMSIAREYKEIFTYKKLYEECIISNNSIIDASVFKKIEMYDESLYGPEDYDLWLRIAEIGPVYHIPEALYSYRITGNNITIATNRQRLIEHLNRVHLKKNQRLNNEQK
jgi:glycosyltransferase involved in cell wall biosynthesis